MDERDEERTLELIDALAGDLSAVKPIPPLRTMVLAVVALWLAVAIAGVSMHGFEPAIAAGLLRTRGPLAIFVGLIGCGLCGLVAALAMGVPGREGLARAALRVGGLAFAAAAGVGTLLLAASPASGVDAPTRADLGCLLNACAVAVLPSFGVIWFAGRTAPHRPLVLVLAAAAGTAALGAATAQTVCAVADARHLLVGHVLGPAAGALVLTLPLLFALRRTTR